MFKAGVLTVSDSTYQGLREDAGGPLICEYLEGTDKFQISATGVTPDEEDEIRKTLVSWVDELGLDIIFTTGGTGLSPRDVTPEATLDVIDRAIPGMSEAIRAYGLNKTPRAMLSRGVVGVRGKCLIINLPGSPKAVRDGLEAVGPVLEHAIMKIQGDTTPCGNP
ncbi:MAG: MogA/MoaB family molybdenum cofactor biosynthesis protein [Thermodesulfobacteria bacterium]|nr:MogA/MoaB family molybdenum cofactor biosynthesis protein [Thermodesulfobacteriota bacterium]